MVSLCVCQSAPVCALVVPVCCERGLYLKNSLFFLSLAFDVMKQRKADMAYRSRAHRHPAHSPHTRRPRARPAPAGRKGSDSLGRQQNEYVESWLNNAE